MAYIYQGVPARQAPLLAKSGAHRGAFAQSLKHLIELELIEPNPGHGHPLRPEFRLTAEGEYWAKIASDIHDLSENNPQTQLLRRSWTLPILAVAREPRYFSDLKKQLSPITDRALSQKLNQLQECDWMAREVDVHQHPPRTLYKATNLGAQISDLLAA